MAKALACIGSTQVDVGIAYINYSVSVLDTLPTSYSYHGAYQVDMGISAAANLTAWKNTIIAEVLAKKSITLLITDVIVFGGPV